MWKGVCSFSQMAITKRGEVFSTFNLLLVRRTNNSLSYFCLTRLLRVYVLCEAVYQFDLEQLMLDNKRCLPAHFASVAPRFRQRSIFASHRALQTVLSVCVCVCAASLLLRLVPVRDYEVWKSIYSNSLECLFIPHTFFSYRCCVSVCADCLRNKINPFRPFTCLQLVLRQ